MKIYKALTISNCIEKASQIARAFNGIDKRKCFVFCEDKITLSLELEIAKQCGGGFFNIDVLTFTRYILNKTSSVKVLSKQSSVMAVRKIILQKQKDLVCFNNLKYCQNVAVTLYELISQLQSAKVTPTDLENLLSSDGDRPEGALEKKLRDIILVYKEYSNYLKERRYYDGNDFMSLMPSFINNDEEIKNSTVILVGFSSVTKQRLDVFKSLYNTAKEIIAVVVADDESEVYTNETYNRLLEIDKNAEVYKIDSDNDGVLSSLKNGLFNPSVFKTGYKGKTTDKISVTEYPDAHTEVEEIAKDIVKQTKLNGKRFKDIAITVCDLAGYKLQFAKVFSEYNIPYYVDKAEILSNHPICRYIASFIDMARKGLAVNDVLNFVCSGMFSADKNLTDNFKLYAKKYSLSRNSFKSPLKYQAEGYDEFEKIRSTVFDVYTKLTSSTNVLEYISAVKYMLEKTGAQNNIDEYALKLKQAGEISYAEFNEKILEKVYVLLDEMQVVLESAKLSMLDFKTVFLSGASTTTIGAIPLFNDAVYIGECKDVKIKKVDILYAVGINGNVPFSKSDTAILTDGDLASLDKFQIIVEPKIRIVNKREKENVCIAFMSFKDKLNVSYTNLSLDGKPTIKSEIIPYLLKIFNLAIIGYRKTVTKYERENNLNGEFKTDYYNYISDKYLSEKSAIREIAKLKSSVNNSCDSSEITSFYKALESIDKTNLNKIADDILNAQTTKPDFITRAGMCLRGSEISATTLEEYFACPYSNYAKNVLKLKPDETGEMQYNEIGTMLHLLAEIYAKRLDEVNCKQASDSLVEEILNELYKREEYAKYLEKPTYKYVFNKLVIEGKKICYDIYKTYENSDFKPYLFEAKFGNNKPREAISLLTKSGSYKVKGAIDRVDKCGNEIRIIDYKSGKIHPDAVSFYTGNNLQLYLYMNAFTRDGLSPAGAYYFQIKDDYVDDDKVKSYVMDGNTVNDTEVLYATDSKLKDGQSSNVVQVKLTNGGKIHKSWSRIVERDEMNELCSYAIKISSKGVDEINAGFIKATPYDEKCKYCEYAGLCSTSVENVNKRKVEGVNFQSIVEASRYEEVDDGELKTTEKSDDQNTKTKN